ILPDLPEHYRSLAKRLNDLGGGTEIPIRFPALVARVLASKSELHLETRKAYESSDREKMRRLLEEVLPETLQGVVELHEAHRSMWRNWYKPFGWEVLDRRYGGLIARLESLKGLLQAWMVNPAIRVEEFEFDLLAVYPEDQPGHFYFNYARAA